MEMQTLPLTLRRILCPVAALTLHWVITGSRNNCHTKTNIMAKLRVNCSLEWLWSLECQKVIFSVFQGQSQPVKPRRHERRIPRRKDIVLQATNKEPLLKCHETAPCKN
ncbi:hypothetical protein QR685DRAFT_253570 [Neurospora intermedia]|uniref:Secreted protein n=1 Tax=Neurospora intermedia TaxID=5142 RepID=A0ABR3DDQ3_NEUIN